MSMVSVSVVDVYVFHIPSENRETTHTQKKRNGFNQGQSCNFEGDSKKIIFIEMKYFIIQSKKRGQSQSYIKRLGLN